MKPWSWTRSLGPGEAAPDPCQRSRARATNSAPYAGHGQLCHQVQPAFSSRIIVIDDDAFTGGPAGRVLSLLGAVETTAQQTLGTVTDIKAALPDTQHRIRARRRRARRGRRSSGRGVIERNWLD